MRWCTGSSRSIAAAIVIGVSSPGLIGVQQRPVQDSQAPAPVEQATEGLESQAGGAAAAQAGEVQLTTVLIAQVDFPTYLTHAPGDFERLFVLEQAGKIRVIKNGVLLDEPFLDVTELVDGDDALQGFLCMAFHPEYQENGYFYVTYTSQPDGDSVISRYQVSADPDIADSASAYPIMTVELGEVAHNIVWIEFNPHDGYFYVAVGDSTGAETDAAQDLDSLLGKLLRLDFDDDDFPEDPERNYAIAPTNPYVGVDGADEIWSYGFRNPWRGCFDPVTGDLFLADAGKDKWEELNFQPAGSQGGENYGWDCKEGTECVGGACDCDDPTLIDPIFEYANGATGSAIIGGYVYRGCSIPELDGAYIFADYGSADSRIWLLRHGGGEIVELNEIQDQLDPGDGLSIDRPTSFGVDALGEIYICDRTNGDVFKILPADPTLADCNRNGVGDACDIAAGVSDDINGDGVPDECQTIGDLNGDGVVGSADLVILLGAWGACDDCALCDPDLDGDCLVAGGDLLILLGNWG